MKKGRIFIPQDYGLNYCKSPQALVFDEYVRVYFSYCVPDGEKLISRVGFVDFDKNFDKVIRVKKDVLIEGKLGTFDEHGIFPFSPFFDKGKVKGITSGWTRRQSVSVDSGLGLVVSEDGGESFTRIGDGPVMTANLNEPYLVADGFVVNRSDEQFVMYYIFGTGWSYYKESAVPERTYRIGIATSNDLLEWNRNGVQIIEPVLEKEAQALPSVAYYKGKWHMVFCYRDTVGFRNNSSNAYRIGYAYSEDMFKWKRDDSKVAVEQEDWCNKMQCYPNIFVMDEKLYMLYNGNDFAKEGFGIMQLEGI